MGGSALSGTLGDLIRDIYRPPPSSATAPRRTVVFQPLREDKQLRLFNIAAALKIAVSEVSMHLPADWRRRLFEKIDVLHEPDNWEEDDKLASLGAFKTFLHTVLDQGPIYRMSLGVDLEGNILAGWRRGRDTLTLTFLPGDRVRWSIVQHIDGEIETASGHTTVDRLPIALKSYSPEVWYGDAAKIPAG
jgi:hypothetical protein